MSFVNFLKENIFLIILIINAAEDFLALASFSTDETMGKCSQESGTFSMELFFTDKLMTLLFWTRWLINRLEIRLKKSLTSTFKRAIGWKSKIDFSDFIAFDLGMEKWRNDSNGKMEVFWL